MPDREKVTAQCEWAIKQPSSTIIESKKFYEEILALLKEQPGIVRCKDCKHRDPEDGKCDSGHDIQWQLPRTDDWFCADGKRK